MKKTLATIHKANFITPTVLELVITKPKGEDFFSFLPGQYVTVSFPSYKKLKGERSFSIASDPTDLSRLRLGIRVYGHYTQALKKIKAGDTVLVSGPFGEFTFNPEKDKSVALFAGGIGVTPFLSMIYYAARNQLNNKIFLFYSARNMDDIPYHDELNELTELNPNFKVIFTISGGTIPDVPNKYFKGWISIDIILWALSNKFTDKSYLICGPPAYMASVGKILKSLGVSYSRHRKEKFGIGSTAIIEPGTPIPYFVMAMWGVVVFVFFVTIFQIENLRRSDVIAASVTEQVNTSPVDTQPIDTVIPVTNTNNGIINSTNSIKIPTNTNTSSITNTQTVTNTSTTPTTTVPVQPKVIPRTKLS